MFNMFFMQEYLVFMILLQCGICTYINILKYNFIVAILQYITYFMYTAIVI